MIDVHVKFDMCMFNFGDSVNDLNFPIDGFKLDYHACFCMIVCVEQERKREK